MTRIVDAVPHYSSVDKFGAEQKAKRNDEARAIMPPEERPHTDRSSVRGIDADKPGWWPGYVDGVIEALSRLDRAREYNELARGNSTAPRVPICTTRL